MCYQNVAVNADSYPVGSMVAVGQEKKAKASVPNSSRVTEGTNRDTFNNNYATITYNKSNKYDLTYKTSDYTSEISYRKDKNESKYNYGYTGNTDGPINGVDEQYMIKANTYNAYNGTLTKIKTEDDIRKNAILEIADINLGIAKREQPDLSLVKDLNQAEVSINGQTHIYKYADRFNQALWEENVYNMSPRVKFGSKYGSMSYTRALYASDVYYKDEDKSKELQVKLTYKIGIKNTSDTLISVVNEIEDYYDVKYYNTKEKIKITKEQLDKTGKVVETKELNNYNIGNSGNSKYNKITLGNIGLTIQPQSEGYIYVELEVQQEQIVELLKNDTKLDNIAQITSYSTKDSSGKVYAGIDKDSQPGNLEIGKQTTYEDDTDKAPGIQLVLQEERRIDGIVFLDSTSGELKTGEIREGDGTYTSGEIGIEGVEVKLINLETNEIAKKYNGKDEKGKWEDAVVKTNSDGTFEIRGLLPDKYKLVYTWGGQKYTDANGKEQTITVQNYKGTIYPDKNRGNLGLEWYKYKPKELRYSDAMDDYSTREEIDKQTTILTNANQEAINNQSSEIELEDGSKQALITTMKSTTPDFRINVEYDDTKPTNSSEEYELKDGKIQLDSNGFVKKTEGHQNYLRNTDFGIVERARQALTLDKVIKSAKLIAANGNTLCNVKIVEDEETGERRIEDIVKHTVYIPNKDGEDGQLKFEIDSEIIQGAKLEVEYGLKVSNISELEYINKEYYLYGSKQGYKPNPDQLVSLKASNIIDYIDNGIATGDELYEKGQILQDTREKAYLFSQGLLDDKLKSYVNGTTRVLIIDSLSQDLKPIGAGGTNISAAEVTIKGYKMLANNEENLLENNAEIIKVQKTGGGASLVTIPGNYLPTTSETEYDDDKAETVYILPPTGLNFNYIAYTLLAISSLGILAIGIILIKKKVQ